MSQLTYLLCISRAEDATELHQLRREAEVDGELSATEREQIYKSIGKRFAALNAAACGKPKPRWAEPSFKLPADFAIRNSQPEI